MEYLNFIAQYKGSIPGTIGGIETFDVVQFNKDESKLYIYKRNNSGYFELTIIKERPFNTEEFQTLLKTPDKLSSQCNLYGGWRSGIVKNPQFMPEEYYYNILSLYNRILHSKNNQLSYIKSEISKLYDKIDEIEKDTGIRAY